MDTGFVHFNDMQIQLLMCKSCLEYPGGVELTAACVYDTVNEPVWLTHQAASAAPFFSVDTLRAPPLLPRKI